MSVKGNILTAETEGKKVTDPEHRRAIQMEAAELVFELHRKVWKLIEDETEHLGPFTRWTIIGRLVQRLFQAHFGASYHASENQMAKAELDAAAEREKSQ